jgi:hypothetical protein
VTPGADLVVLDYYAMIAAGIGGDREAERSAAETILRNLPSVEMGERASLTRRDAETIREAARAAIERRPNVPVVRQERIGRNEWVTVRYQNGRTERAKYKRVEEEIRAGRCVLVEREGIREQREDQPARGSQHRSK